MELNTVKDVEKGLTGESTGERQGSGNANGEGSTTDDFDPPLHQAFSSSSSSAHSNSNNYEPFLDLDEPMLWLSYMEGKSLIKKVQPWPFLEQQQKGDDESNNKSGKNSYKINLAELQRLRLQELQYKLIGHVRRMHTGEDEKGDWRNDLQQYGMNSDTWMCGLFRDEVTNPIRFWGLQ